MAEHLTRVIREFDAGHVIHGDPECWAPGHGHRWRVEVTVRGSYDVVSGRTLESVGLDQALDTLIGEVGGRSLNLMMPGGFPTEGGVALWVMERLQGGFPKLVEVTVWRDPYHSSSIRREPR